jgi:hypothetical protein
LAPRLNHFPAFGFAYDAYCGDDATRRREKAIAEKESFMVIYS